MTRVSIVDVLTLHPINDLAMPARARSFALRSATLCSPPCAVVAVALAAGSLLGCSDDGVGPEPTVLVADAGPVDDLEVDDDTLYWVAGGEVSSMPRSGGSVVPVAGTPEVCDVASDGTYLYLLTGDVGSVYYVTSADGATEPVFDGDSPPYWRARCGTLAMAPAWVFAGVTQGQLMTASKGLSISTVLDMGVTITSSVADSDALYFLSTTDLGSDDMRSVQRLVEGGSEIETLASDRPTARSLTADDTHLYWVEWVQGSDSFRIMSIAKNGGELRQVVHEPFGCGFFSDIAAVAGTVYYGTGLTEPDHACGPGDWAILEVAPGSAARRIFAKHESMEEPRQLRVRDGMLYFNDCDFDERCSVKSLDL